MSRLESWFAIVPCLALAAAAAADPALPPLTLRPVATCRLLDTAASGPLEPGQSLALRLAGGDDRHCSDAFRAGAGRAPRAVVLRAELDPRYGAGRLLAGKNVDAALPIAHFGAAGEPLILPFVVVELCRSGGDACAAGDLAIAAEGMPVEARIDLVAVLEGPAAFEQATPSPNPASDPPAPPLAPRQAEAPFWERDPADGSLSYQDGFVGIGTADPESPLHIAADFSGALISQPATFGGETQSNYFEPRYPALFLRRESSNRGVSLALGNQTGKTYLYGSAGGFKIYDTNGNQRFFLRADGQLALGVTDPTVTLDVAGDAPARIQQSSSLGLSTESPYFAPDNPTLKVVRASSNKGATLAIGNQTRRFFLYGNHEILRIYAPDGVTPIETLTPNGNVGIGSLAPSERLEIQGNVKLSGSIVSDGDICIGSC